MEIIIIILFVIWGTLLLIDFRMVEIANKWIEYVNQKEEKKRLEK